jgi:nucleoside-diphosphate-sugar epimerase
VNTRAGNTAVNVNGSLNLFEAAGKAGVQRMVFISTMSAFPECKSMYGQAKLAVETRAEPWKIHIVRPGLVYGPGCRGMVGSLAKLAGLPILPLVGNGGQVLYLAHQEDLGNLVRGMCDGTIPRQDKAVIAASKRSYTLREILKLLAASQNKKPLLIPVPWQIEWLALRCMESIGIRLRVRSDGIISLINQDASPDFAPTDHVKAVFRDFADEIRKGANVT